MSTYGFEIVQTLIVDIEPDEHVKRAMNEINAGKLLTMIFCTFCLLATLASLFMDALIEVNLFSNGFAYFCII